MPDRSWTEFGRKCWWIVLVNRFLRDSQKNLPFSFSLSKEQTFVSRQQIFPTNAFIWVTGQKRLNSINRASHFCVCTVVIFCLAASQARSLKIHPCIYWLRTGIYSPITWDALRSNACWIDVTLQIRMETSTDVVAVRWNETVLNNLAIFFLESDGPIWRQLVCPSHIVEMFNDCTFPTR